MPTDNPRVTFMIEKSQLDRVETFQHEHRIKSTSKAIVRLLEVGMDEIEKEENRAPPSPPPDTLTAEIERFVRTLNTEQADMLVSILSKVSETVKGARDSPAS